MIKKTIAYQKLLMQGFRTADRGKGVWIVFLIAFVLSVVLGILQVAVSEFFCFMGSLFIWAQMGSILNNNNKLSRSLPVSDRFAVANMLFIAPLVTVFIALWTLAVMMLVGFFLHLCLEGNTISLLEINTMFLLKMFDGADIWRMGFVFCICGGLWCWMGYAAFHRDRRVRIMIVAIVSAAAFGVLVLINDIVRRHSGYHGKLGVGDFLELSNWSVMLVCAFIFMVGSAIFAWNRSLKLYRTDVLGQARCTEKEEGIYDIYGNQSQTATRFDGLTGVKRILAVVCVLAAIAAVFIFLLKMTGVIMTDGDRHVAMESSDVRDYEEWNSIPEVCKIPSDLTDDYVVTVFPNTIDENYVEQYYAKGDGNYSYIAGEKEGAWSGSYSLVWMRFLAVSLPKDEYMAEKRRVASLSVTYQGKGKVEQNTNYVIRDTEHFAYESYIAVWDDTMENYEYVLFDDASGRIFYVFTANETYRSIDTDYDICPKSPGNVIPLKLSNDQNKAFSIYSFWDGDFYDYYKPGM